MKNFIFRHFNHFQVIRAKNEQDAKLIFLGKRVKDFYYYKIVAVFDYRKQAKAYINENKGIGYL